MTDCDICDKRATHETVNGVYCGKCSPPWATKILKKGDGCTVCNVLRDLGEDEEKIKRYHNSVIGMEDFPPLISKELSDYYKSLRTLG